MSREYLTHDEIMTRYAGQSENVAIEFALQDYMLIGTAYLEDNLPIRKEILSRMFNLDTANRTKKQEMATNVGKQEISKYLRAYYSAYHDNKTFDGFYDSIGMTV